MWFINRKDALVARRCENIKIRFQQRDIWPDVWELVSPGQSQDYAWDEILLPHRLRVVFDTEGTPFTDATVHEYNLDIIRVSLDVQHSNSVYHPEGALITFSL